MNNARVARILYSHIHVYYTCAYLTRVRLQYTYIYTHNFSLQARKRDGTRRIRRARARARERMIYHPRLLSAAKIQRRFRSLARSLARLRTRAAAAVKGCLLRSIGTARMT